MRAQSTRRITLALVVLALLAPVMAQALPINAKSVDGAGIGELTGKPMSWMDVLWQGLVRLWAGSTAPEPGSDPGATAMTPTSGGTPPTTGAGPYIDPHGGSEQG
jgi:hypothetical protein